MVIATGSFAPQVCGAETKTYTVRVTDNTVFSDPADKLEAYLSNSYLTGAGMCDGMQTAVVYLKGNESIGIEEMRMISPVSNTTYYWVKRVSGKQEFFTKTTDAGGKVVVQLKENAMEWSIPLMQQSPNYFLYHFYGKEKPNDCSQSKQ
jgi:hypothetical protein